MQIPWAILDGASGDTSRGRCCRTMDFAAETKALVRCHSRKIRIERTERNGASHRFLSAHRGLAPFAQPKIKH